MIEIQNKDGLDLLSNDVKNNSIDLILTDPPYIISKNSGMNIHYNNVKNNLIEKKKQKKNGMNIKKKIKLKMMIIKIISLIMEAFTEKNIVFKLIMEIGIILSRLKY